MTAELAFASVEELRGLIRAGQVCVREVVEACLGRIESLDSSLNAVVAPRAEAAMREAAAADRMAPAQHGPLHGVPFTVKDVTETLDLPTTWGSPALADHRTDYEAAVVGHLRRAGAILVGKTNTAELASEPVTRGGLFGETRNPWALQRTPGGSSGGAAAGLAAGLFTLAQGTDAGGSIRIPASCCGLVGIKPTRGRVSFAPAARDPWGGLLHSGPLARSVRDAAVMLDVMAGPGAGERNLLLAPPNLRDACERPPGRLRVAYTSKLPVGELDADVASAFAGALDVLRELGLEPVPTAPDVSALGALFATIAESTFAGLAAPLTARQLELVGTTSRQLIERGRRIAAGEYLAAIEAAYHESLAILRFWDEHDVLVTPTVPWVPPPRDQLPATEEYEAKWAQYGSWEAFTLPWNVTGQPAISLPCPTWSGEGLPIGVQLVGGFGAEADLVSLAAAYEATAPWRHRRPPDFD
ncbi:MAG TPA: amidase [Solirubrobacteraceae bacterium]|nr:amidase [Solirubrobacteraceae bacterium]